ncbi:amidohydrolase family protein [Nitratireductor sp. XY-223]|uniref:amidohydrolase family protein n=1 Tax=Nitratireductor sp. XY-223 TaxID=2561926 RepID=UPI0010AAB97F|nr:amidohydrolase family protein [Nitratireductor sp. XY-223]
MKYQVLLAVFATLFGLTALADDGHGPIGDAIEDVPIFDAHVHYKEPAWGPYPPETVIALMDRNGVAMALVSSTPDEGTIRLFEFAPDRIVPELRPYHGSAGSGNWTKAEGMLDYLRDRLQRFPHEGLGEFHVHSLDPSDRPFLEEVAALAVDHDIPIHIHSGFGPVELFYEFAPSLTIIWAHAGMSDPPETVDRMMSQYPTLYADTSYREGDILRNWERWQPVIMRHADRLMVGSDTWVNSQWADYDGLIAKNRQWLARLPRETAEKIAFRNAAKLFGREDAFPDESDGS